MNIEILKRRMYNSIEVDGEVVFSGTPEQCEQRKEDIEGERIFIVSTDGYNAPAIMKSGEYRVIKMYKKDGYRLVRGDHKFERLFRTAGAAIRVAWILAEDDKGYPDEEELLSAADTRATFWDEGEGDPSTPDPYFG